MVASAEEAAVSVVRCLFGIVAASFVVAGQFPFSFLVKAIVDPFAAQVFSFSCASTDSVFTSKPQRELEEVAYATSLSAFLFLRSSASRRPRMDIRHLNSYLRQKIQLMC